MKNLRDLEKAIEIAVDKLSDVEFNFDYLETEYLEMKEKLEDITSICEEKYSPETKIIAIKEILER